MRRRHCQRVSVLASRYACAIRRANLRFLWSVKMQKKIIDIISQDFPEESREVVIECLSTINLTHVMAQSESNLENVYLSILYLADGNVDEVIHLTKAAKKDFRDVIYWAILERRGPDK